MSCESCYNGCVQTVSDECVRYTGINYDALGVESGDNLVSVEQAIMNALTPLLTGQGDAIVLNSSCPIIDEYLPGHTPNTKELFQAVVSAICSLQYQVFTIDDVLAVLNANYNIGCLTGVTSSSDTHDIVQAIINKVCSVASELTALELDVATNYVKLADFNALVAAYLASQSTSTQQYNKMVPYAVYEYYGPLTNFDTTGAGYSNLGFANVYLCNGLNGTPDKRGRVTVGAISGVPSTIPLDASVNPANPGNPNYALYTTTGQNTVALVAGQMPAHSHGAVANTFISINDPGHSHFAGHTPIGWSSSGSIGVSNETPKNIPTTSSTTGITATATTDVTIQSAGNGDAHANIQPVIAAYYIMYIP